MSDWTNAGRRNASHTSTGQTTVGFVGLGKMGAPMVRRLLAAGFPVVGANRSQRIVEELAAEGMRPAVDAAEVAAHADVVLTALPTEAVVGTVTEALVDAARTGQVVVEHSTISPGLARHNAARFVEQGVGYLDAPVSGGPAGAEAGTLTVMVGGEPDVLDGVQPVLAAFGDPIRLCGEVGAGEAIKLVNQLLVGLHTAAAAEAAAFGAALGLDAETIGEVVGTSFGGSTMLARSLPRFASGDFSAATSVRLLLKDLGLVHDEALAGEVPLRLGAMAEQLFSEAGARGHLDDDMAALVRLWPNADAVRR